MHDRLKAPFPAFGGKARVADLVWERLGDVSNFIEPFCNSAAVLLARPHPPRIEAVNDLDCYIANFWRAVAEDPEAVAEHADWPVNEADLHARHRWLVLSEAAVEFRRRMRTDPDYYDPKVAGWWVWGACCWIGSGWCDEIRADTEQLPCLTGHLKDPKKGICYGGSLIHQDAVPDLTQKLPRLTGGRKGDEYYGGLGVHATISDAHRPQLADAYARGRGVHGNDAAGTCAQRRAWLIDWFGRLRDRLRTVRVCCGSWDRVCSSPSVTTRLGLTAVFLDPPYPTHAADGSESRTGKLYATDGNRDDLDKLRDEVLAWCRARGPDPLMRIAICGYDTDGYASLEELGWESVSWVASGGYGNRSDKGKANAQRERIWFSPHCIKPGDDMPLFAKGTH